MVGLRLLGSIILDSKAKAPSSPMLEPSSSSSSSSSWEANDEALVGLRDLRQEISR